MFWLRLPSGRKINNQILTQNEAVADHSTKYYSNYLTSQLIHRNHERMGTLPCHTLGPSRHWQDGIAIRSEYFEWRASMDLNSWNCRLRRWEFVEVNHYSTVDSNQAIRGKFMCCVPTTLLRSKGVMVLQPSNIFHIFHRIGILTKYIHYPASSCLRQRGHRGTIDHTNSKTIANKSASKLLDDCWFTAAAKRQLSKEAIPIMPPNPKRTQSWDSSARWTWW